MRGEERYDEDSGCNRRGKGDRLGHNQKIGRRMDSMLLYLVQVITNVMRKLLKNWIIYSIKYKYYQCDIGNRESRIQTVETIVKDFGGIHVLVNNAGIAPQVRRGSS